MNLLQLCFEGSTNGFIEIAVGGLTKSHRKWYPYDSMIALVSRSNEAYFGPALRADRAMGRKACSGSFVTWVDIDDEEKPVSLLPPTAVVNSGHGWHYYWKLDSFLIPERIEEINMALRGALGSDSVQNIDRLMRLPGSMNRKDSSAPIECILETLDPSRIYSPTDLMGVARLPDNIVKKIITGDARGYHSRSERDWAIVRALVENGVSDAIIHRLFEIHGCGDKKEEANDQYLDRTIGKLRQKVSATVGSPGTNLEVRDNCYFTSSRRARQLSTFILIPTYILSGEEEDCFICTVQAAGTNQTWEGIPFPRSSFNSVRAFGNYLPRAEWVWMGSDSDTRQLAAHLVQLAQGMDVPRAVGTSILGRHTVADIPYIVTPDGTVGQDGTIWTEDAPIMYVPTGREHPITTIQGNRMDDARLREMAELLPKINEPGKLYPILGWFMASPMKPVIEDAGYRFPILNVAGTRGSGKTTTILRVFQPLMGHLDCKAHDVDTTNFVALSLLGSTNAVPVSFSEYRSANTAEFTRFLLLSYDSGRDARGRPDQTTVEYPLLAPISLDGEDKVEDAACQERMIVVFMSPATIIEGSEHHSAGEKFQALDLSGFAVDYWIHTLRTDVPRFLEKARKEVVTAFPRPLPDRIRRNLTVAWFGVLVYHDYLASRGIELATPTAEVLAETLEAVYSSTLGRAPLAADDFLEYVANTCLVAGKMDFKLDGELLWFQLAPAYASYNITKSRSRQVVLSRDAIARQLDELSEEYLIKRQLVEIGGRMVLAYCFNIKLAQEAGLDIPTSVRATAVTITVEEFKHE